MSFKVFKMTCHGTGKSYVGMTSKEIQVEANNIFNLAERGGYNRVADQMVYDICLHGRDEFELTLVKDCQVEIEARKLRMDLISELGCRDVGGYNFRRNRGVDVHSIETKLTPELRKLAEMGSEMTNLRAVGLVYDKPAGYLRLYQHRYERFLEMYKGHSNKLTKDELCKMFSCSEEDADNLEWYLRTTRKDDTLSLAS